MKLISCSYMFLLSHLKNTLKLYYSSLTNLTFNFENAKYVEQINQFTTENFPSYSKIYQIMIFLITLLSYLKLMKKFRMTTGVRIFDLLINNYFIKTLIGLISVWIVIFPCVGGRWKSDYWSCKRIFDVMSLFCFVLFFISR